MLAWWLSCVVLLLAISALIPVFGFWVSDSGSRFLQVLSIQKQHFRWFSIDYPLAGLDPHFVVQPFGRIQTFTHNGMLYSQYPPYFAFVAAILYSLVGKAALRILPILGGVMLFPACWRLARRMGLVWPGIACLAALFGTPVLPYAFTFWDIVPAIALATWSLVFAADACEEGRGATVSGLAAGFCCAVAFVLREEYILWGACICGSLLLFAPRRSFVMAAAGFVVPVALVVMFNYASVGWPLYLFPCTGARDEPWTLASRLDTVYRYLAHVTEDWFLNALFFLATVALTLVALLRPGRAFAVCCLAFAAVVLVRDFAWNPVQPFVSQFTVNSAVASAPIVFVAIPSLVVAILRRFRKKAGLRARDAAAGVIGTSILGYLFVVLLASPHVTSIGFHWGPRILLTIYPVLVLCGFGVFQKVIEDGGKWRTPLLVMAGLLVLVGFADNAVYLKRLYAKKVYSAQVMSVVRSTAPLPVLTDTGWLGSEMSPLFYERPLIGILRPEQIRPAIGIARRINPREAICITYGKLPTELAEQCTTGPVEQAAGVKPPDYLFSLSFEHVYWLPPKRAE